MIACAHSLSVFLPILLFLVAASARIESHHSLEKKKMLVNDPYFYFCGSESCYDVLHLAHTANKTEIKSSYRKLAALYHPDKNGSDEAKERLQVIMKAYKVLMDDGKDSEGNWKMKEKFDYYLVSIIISLLNSTSRFNDFRSNFHIEPPS